MRNHAMLHAFEALSTSVLDTPVGSLVIQALQRHHHVVRSMKNRKSKNRSK